MDGVKVGEGTAVVDKSSGFSFDFRIPEKINLGIMSISVIPDQSELGKFQPDREQRDILGHKGSTPRQGTNFIIEVEEYRRPEFDMKVTAASTNIGLGEATKLSARAAYFGGGALPGTTVKWAVQATPYAFHPPKWIDFKFGKEFYNFPQQTLKKNLDATSDKDGVSVVELKALSISVPMSVSMHCEATFNDVNRQTWSDNTTVIMHSCKAFIGSKLTSDANGENVKGKLIVTDDGGKPIIGRPVVAGLYKLDDEGKKVQLASWQLTSAEEAVDFDVALKDGSTNFSFEATSTDASGRAALNQYQYFVYRGLVDLRLGGNPPKKLKITTDHEQYIAGQSAEITIASPVFPAEGLLVVSRRRVRTTIPIKLTGETTSVSLPISEDDYPNLFLQAFVNGKDGLHATGTITVAVPPSNKTLTVTVNPAKNELAPGSATSLDVSLKDHNGAAVPGGHVAIAVIDEAVLALHPFGWPNAIGKFYPLSEYGAMGDLSRSSIRFPVAESDKRRSYFEADGIHVANGRQAAYIFGQSDAAPVDRLSRGLALGGSVNSSSLGSALRHSAMAMPMAAPMIRMKGDNAYILKESHGVIAARQNFAELALFAPDVVTDRDGHAKVSFTLPDSTTKYRIMAVAVKDLDKFGASENTLSTKMALSIKPSLPRFLNFGDRCELPLVVQNQTDRVLSADIVVRVQNGKSTTVAGKKVDIPANDRVEVRFPVSVGAPGAMSVQSAAFANELTDATSSTIPVMVPATYESVAAYGQIDKGANLQKLDCPKDVYPQLGGLSITTSSTALQSLTDAYMYLRDYPYDCSEQLSARVLAMLALHDSLAAFGILNAEGESQYQSVVKESLKKLIDRQLLSGGFGLWSAMDEDRSPYLSMQVIKALSRASAKDFAVDPLKFADAKNYLKDIKSHIPADYSDACRNAIRAQALRLRHDIGEDDATEAKQLVAELSATFAPDYASKGSSPVEIACWLLPVLSKSADASTEIALLRRVINNAVIETGSTASANVKGFEPWFYLLYYSPRRVDAEVLDALIEDQPDSELIPKLVKGLLAHRKNGAWNGTQENYIILEALDKYFHRYEKDVPNFTAREWVGANFVGQQSFVGRTTESKSLTVPTTYLLEHAANDVLIAKDGPGRLYYRMGLNYVPRNLVLKPLSLGFDVSKTYEGVEKKEDASRDAEGAWHFKAGALVKCKVHFANIGARYHVALMVPMPGGCEPVNGMLSGNQTILPDENPAPPRFMHSPRGGFRAMPLQHSRMIWWKRDWYEHQNLRDHQAEAFASLLNAGEHDYSYTMRATTPGKFVVPPTKIKEMYDEETFGRTGTETVIVE